MSGRPSSNATAGHTLLELLVVLAILALIVGIAAPRASRYGDLGKEKAQETQLAAITVALHSFRDDVGRLPTNEEGLGALLRAPSGVVSWGGPYLASPVLRDPWGHQLTYRSPGRSSDFDIFSDPAPDLHHDTAVPNAGGRR